MQGHAVPWKGGMTVKKRLGEMLLEAGVIDETQLHAALGHQRKWGGKLGQALLDLKLATEPQVVAALSRKFGYTTVDVATLARTPQLEAALRLVPRELALRQTMLPVSCDSGSITVAMADPSNIAVVDELSFRTGRRVKIVVAGDREIGAAVRRLYYAHEEAPLDPIPIEEISSDSPFETTRDPLWSIPDSTRDGAPALPTRDAAPDGLAGPRPAQIAPQPAPPPPPDELGEPILATDLAPVEDDDAEGRSEWRLTPRESAMLDALERAVRGEETGLVKPAQLAAALARLLLRRGVVSKEELLQELLGK